LEPFEENRHHSCEVWSKSNDTSFDQTFRGEDV